MQKGRKLGEISINILTTLFQKGVEAVEDYIDAWKYDEFVRLRVYKQLYNLERQGYVKIERRAQNQSFFHLTPKGRLQILKHLHLEKLGVKKWDGRWRIVVFDVPEDRRKWRERLRIMLVRSLGFYPLQESVYITPYPVPKELDEILEDKGLREHFRYLTVTEIDGEPQLKRQFGLK